MRFVGCILLLCGMFFQDMVRGAEKNTKRVRWRDHLTVCPVCRKKIYFAEPDEDRKNPPSARDPLASALFLREHDVHPKAIWMCPVCGYTAMFDTFSRLSNTGRAAIVRSIKKLRPTQKEDYYAALPIFIRLKNLYLCNKLRGLSAKQQLRCYLIGVFWAAKSRNKNLSKALLDKARSAAEAYYSEAKGKADVDGLLDQREALLWSGCVTYFSGDKSKAYDIMAKAAKVRPDPTVQLTPEQTLRQREQNLFISRYLRAIEKGVSVLKYQ
ncbi:MAG: DUF2225 domain-containing protein [Lentisphaerae bacterium]|nr:MAG: DUF2225 domain-containing protein [Lentisphaerota bacterium]